jgi:toxin ParE1/3/4
MRVVLTEQAEADLEAIGDYIAAESPLGAMAFIRQIREQCERISRAPYAYAARPQLGAGIRLCPHGNYLILFSAAEEEVLIVRIVHGARDIVALFSGD